MGRGVIIALAASLAVNVFLGGYLIGRKSTSQGPQLAEEMHRGPPPRGGEPVGRLIAEAARISPEIRDAVRQATASQRGAFIRDRRELVRLRGDLRDALMAEEFDREAARAAATALSDFNGAREGRRLDVLLSVFEELSIDERRSLLEEMESRRDERRGRWRDRRGGTHRGGRPDGPPPPDVNPPDTDGPE